MNEFEHTIEEVNSDVNPVPRQELRNIWGNFQTITSAPTKEPTTFQNQIQIYSTGGVWRIYIYDTVGKVWKYATLT